MADSPSIVVTRRPAILPTGVEHDARRDAVEMHGAGAAEAAAAAELGADEIEVIAQDPEQRRLRIDVELDGAVVDGQRNDGHASVIRRRPSFSFIWDEKCDERCRS